MSLLDETFGTTVLNSRYIKHPAEGLAQDGDPVSAGQAQILSNNIVHLARESVRPLIWAEGPGNPGKSGDPSGYNGLVDVRQPYGTLADHQKISWDRTTSMKFGPFFAVPDQDAAINGFVLWRCVRVAIYGMSATTNSCKVTVALCPEGHTPFDNIYYYLGTWTSLPTTRGYVTFSTYNRAPVSSSTPTTNVRCRAESGVGAYVPTYPFNVYVGWYSTDSGDSVDTVSGWESREVTVT